MLSYKLNKVRSGHLAEVIRNGVIIFTISLGWIILNQSSYAITQQALEPNNAEKPIASLAIPELEPIGQIPLGKPLTPFLRSLNDISETRASRRWKEVDKVLKDASGNECQTWGSLANATFVGLDVGRMRLFSYQSDKSLACVTIELIKPANSDSKLVDLVRIALESQLGKPQVSPKKKNTAVKWRVGRVAIILAPNAEVILLDEDLGEQFLHDIEARTRLMPYGKGTAETMWEVVDTDAEWMRELHNMSHQRYIEGIAKRPNLVDDGKKWWGYITKEDGLIWTVRVVNMSFDDDGSWRSYQSMAAFPPRCDNDRHKP